MIFLGVEEKRSLPVVQQNQGPLCVTAARHMGLLTVYGAEGHSN